MTTIEKRRVGTPNLAEVGEIALQLFKASKEKRSRRYLYSEKCEEYKELNDGERFSTDSDDFREFTKKAFDEMKKSKADEYNAQRRFERACVAFLK